MRILLWAALALFLFAPGFARSQRIDLGARRGGGGGDGNRPARSTPTPSFSRPNESRQSGTRAPRPSQESRPSRPAGSGNSRPTINPGGGNRPPNVGGGNRPNRPGLPDRPNLGGGNRPNRPSLPDRPGIGGGDRPNRPSLPDRPGTGGGDRPNRPGLPDRPGIGGGDRPNRPGLPDRPGIGGGNRPPTNIGGRPPINIGNDNKIIINRPNRPIRPPYRPININNRPININTIRPGSRPWYDYHYHHWHRGYWSWWRPAGWLVGGAAAGWMLAPRQPTFVYRNPFYDQSVTVFNYSQPLPPPPNDPVNDAQSLNTADAAIASFDQAREAFQQGDHKEALTLVDKAIQELPTDATLHEFRALCLFALKDYTQAAAALYAVLGAGPGWDWETMNYLYPDAATYTAQLRALEAYQRANPMSAEASFVLAYHYLVLSHVDAAIKQLENVVKLLPESQLSAELLAALRTESSREAPQLE